MAGPEAEGGVLVSGGIALKFRDKQNERPAFLPPPFTWGSKKNYCRPATEVTVLGLEHCLAAGSYSIVPIEDFPDPGKDPWTPAKRFNDFSLWDDAQDEDAQDEDSSEW